MPKIDVPPTKSSLRKIKEDLSFAYEGFDLLNQKREILVMEIVKNINKIKKIENEFKSSLNELYNHYRIAAIEMGSCTLTLKSSSEKQRYFMSTSSSKLMGLKLPVISIKRKNLKVFSGLAGTTCSYDSAKAKSIDSLTVLADYATVSKSIFMLSKELKKVQRRVNALEKIFIPQNEDTRKFITDRLEEIEREEIFVKKLIKQQMQGKSL